MADRWALAFSVAAVLAVVAGAEVRRSARRAASPRSVRRSGGVVVLAALVGLVFAPDWPRTLVSLVPSMAGMAVAGFLADRGQLRGRGLAAAIVAISVVPVVGGARIEFVGVPATDAVVTVGWIAFVTAAVAGLGNTDGLLAGVAATVAGGVFGLAAFGTQDALAAVAAAIVGACFGFLTYNLRPASLYVGQTGGLCLGVALATIALDLEPSIAAPGNLAIPVMLLGLPIADAVMVVFARLRHRRPLTTRRSDHMPHRLRALGWRPARVLRTLVLVQVVLSVLAIFVGRGVLPVAFGLPAAAVMLLVLAVVAGRGPVYDDRPEGLSARVLLLGFGLVAFAVLASIPGGLAVIEARDSLEDGRALAQRAISAARDGEPDVAAERFEEAADAFAEASDALHNPTVLGGLVVPVFGSNLHAARELSDAGLDLSRAGERLTGPVDPEKLRVRGGTINLAEVERITPSLEEAASLVATTESRVADLPTGFLLPEVRDAVDDVEAELVRASSDASHGAGAARLAPDILGADKPRRYFVAVQNPAELRATGGFIGNWGILTADNGKVDLEFIDPIRVLNEAVRERYEGVDPDRILSGPDEYLRRYGRFEPALTWQNVNMSPDFRVVGEVITELYRKSGGEKIDGVIAVDPAGLAALLELTGPVPVEGWPESITSENVVDVTLRDAYQAFENENSERQEFVGDIAEEVFDVATDVDLGRPGTVADVLGQASREGHISVYFTRPEEEALSELVNTEGSLPSSVSDSLMVVTQNAGANKIDYYLRRNVEYAVTIDPVAGGAGAEIRGDITVDLENTAPGTGLPQAVIGPSEGLEDRFVAGENFSFVSVFTPLLVDDSTLDNAVTRLEDDRELGRNVFATFLSIYAQSTSTVALEVEGAVRLDEDRWYTLELVRQPFLAPDNVSVKLQVPEGWRVAETDGLRRTGDHGAEGQVELTETTTVRIRLEPTGALNLWDRLNHGV